MRVGNDELAKSARLNEDVRDAQEFSAVLLEVEEFSLQRKVLVSRRCLNDLRKVRVRTRRVVSRVMLIIFRAAAPPTIAGSADSRITAVRDRYDVIKQTVLRNEHFSPSTLPSKLHDRLLNVKIHSSS